MDSLTGNNDFASTIPARMPRAVEARIQRSSVRTISFIKRE